MMSPIDQIIKPPIKGKVWYFNKQDTVNFIKKTANNNTAPAVSMPLMLGINLLSGIRAGFVNFTMAWEKGL